jgi:GntP family gluconate:H+ symporter
MISVNVMEDVMSQTTAVRPTSIVMFLPDWPLLIWMVVITLAIGLSSGLSAQDLVHTFNSGFGRALGEFALILLPSFTLAAAMDRHHVGHASGVAVAASPLAGAGMICPDTAYAALSSVAGTKRLDVAFGSYAGFKLLYPAGPLIVATGLGVTQDWLLLYGLALLIPVWAVGSLWGRAFTNAGPTATHQLQVASLNSTILVFGPFLILAFLLIAGSLLDFSKVSFVDFITQPKGALLAAGAIALAGVAGAERRKCLDVAVRRSAGLLLLIGVASAFGAVLTEVVAIDALIPSGAGLLGILGLFVLTAMFKLVQGSSMATFAAIGSVAAPIVAGMDVAPAAAVFAICAGSFVAILPNDSFYWLVRRDALQLENDARALTILAGGALLQAVTGLAVIVMAVMLGIV